MDDSSGSERRRTNTVDGIGGIGKSETGRLNVFSVVKTPPDPLRSTQMIRMLLLLVVSLAFITSAQTARTAGQPKEPLAALEKKLHGTWEADDMDCVGNLTLRADGAFERQHYSPGNNKLTGAWAVRWNALPPTLVLTCKASNDPDFVGKTFEVKVTQLDDETLAYQFPVEPNNPGMHRYKRAKK
jgi:hypothetical protein